MIQTGSTNAAICNERNPVTLCRNLSIRHAIHQPRTIGLSLSPLATELLRSRVEEIHAGVYALNTATRVQASQAVMDWMVFYHHCGLHSSLGYLSPMQYEQRRYEARRKKTVRTVG